MPETPEYVASRKRIPHTKPINTHFDMPLYEKIIRAAQEEEMFPGQFVRYAVDHFFDCPKKKTIGQ